MNAAVTDAPSPVGTHDQAPTVFSVPTAVITGLGSLQALPSQVARLDIARVALIADRGLALTGLLDRIAGNNLPVNAVILIDPSPGASEVENAVERCFELGCDGVVAVGGGSALGAAKAVAIRMTNPGHILDFEGAGQVRHLPAPLIAIPTTAGSGSEVSNALVLHEPNRSREVIIRGVGCQPAVAILDGTVLRALPRSPMLYAALDALSHAMESLWSRGRSPFTDALAVYAATTILTVLPATLSNAAMLRVDAAAEPKRDLLLQRLLDASCAANMACGNSGLALVHALSAAPIVALPHGYQNGNLLLAVADFNAPVMSPTHRPLISQIRQVYDEIEITGRFSAGEIGPAQVTAMVAASEDHPFRANNIRETTGDDLFDILRAAGAAPAPSARSYS